MRFVNLVMLLFITITPILVGKLYLPQKTNQEFQQGGMEALIIVAIAAAVTTSVYSVEQQRKAAHEAQDKAKKLQAQQRAEQQQIELQAGEYWEDISEKQMMLQASENKFKTLADLMLLKVKKQKEGGQEILTTPVNPPAQKTTSIIDQINQSIDKFLRG